MENVDQKIINYAKTCKNGEMTTKGFKTSVEGMTFSAKAATVATKALSVALNMVADALITKTPNNCSAKNIDKILIIFEVRSIVNYNYFWRMVIYGILFF